MPGPDMNERETLSGFRRLRGWWRFAGLASAGTAARAFFRENGKGVLLYNHLPSETTIVVAGTSDAAEDLRGWFEIRGANGRERAASRAASASSEIDTDALRSPVAPETDLSALEAVRGVLDLMSTSWLPFDERDPDFIAPHSNGYSVWFIGREDNYTENGQLMFTAPLSAEQILAKIEARHGH